MALAQGGGGYDTRTTTTATTTTTSARDATEVERETKILRDRHQTDLVQLERMNQALVDQATELRTQIQKAYEDRDEAQETLRDVQKELGRLVLENSRLKGQHQPKQEEFPDSRFGTGASSSSTSASASSSTSAPQALTNSKELREAMMELERMERLIQDERTKRAVMEEELKKTNEEKMFYWNSWTRDVSELEAMNRLLIRETEDLNQKLESRAGLLGGIGVATGSPQRASPEGREGPSSPEKGTPGTKEPLEEPHQTNAELERQMSAGTAGGAAPLRS